MKEIVNVKIKFREPFRPFAPSVLAERGGALLRSARARRHYPARFMLYVVDVKPGQGEVLPAITHVDGTARLQTVHRAESPLYYSLIERFGQATGVPVILNTSFNLKGEPIVTTPANAFSTFTRSGMDALVLGNTIVRKDVSARCPASGRLRPPFLADRLRGGRSPSCCWRSACGCCTWCRTASGRPTRCWGRG